MPVVGCTRAGRLGRGSMRVVGCSQISRLRSAGRGVPCARFLATSGTSSKAWVLARSLDRPAGRADSGLARSGWLRWSQQVVVSRKVVPTVPTVLGRSKPPKPLFKKQFPDCPSCPVCPSRFCLTLGKNRGAMQGPRPGVPAGGYRYAFPWGTHRGLHGTVGHQRFSCSVTQKQVGQVGHLGQSRKRSKKPQVERDPPSQAAWDRVGTGLGQLGQPYLRVRPLTLRWSSRVLRALGLRADGGPCLRCRQP